MIRVQREDFDVGARARTPDRRQPHGSAASRALSGWCATSGGRRAAIGAMTLEHYPGMTEKKLAEIEAEAQPALAARGVADHPPLRQARAGRPDRAGRDRLAASRRGARGLPFPDRLAKDRGAVLEARGDARRANAGSKRAPRTTPRNRAGAETVSRPGRGPACRGALGHRPAVGLTGPAPIPRPAASPGSD